MQGATSKANALTLEPLLLYDFHVITKLVITKAGLNNEAK